VKPFGRLPAFGGFTLFRGSQRRPAPLRTPPDVRDRDRARASASPHSTEQDHRLPEQSSFVRRSLSNFGSAEPPPPPLAPLPPSPRPPCFGPKPTISHPGPPRHRGSEAGLIRAVVLRSGISSPMHEVLAPELSILAYDFLYHKSASSVASAVVCLRGAQATSYMMCGFSLFVLFVSVFLSSDVA
jgi:hypothetical protein